jgi:hypothetical protein
MLTSCWNQKAMAHILRRCSTALLVQLLLSINRRDVAQTIYQSAKSFGEDSMLMQVMEAWIGMKTVSLWTSTFLDFQNEL